jgi:hypothetical protein
MMGAGLNLTSLRDSQVELISRANSSSLVRCIFLRWSIPEVKQKLNSKRSLYERKTFYIRIIPLSSRQHNTIWGCFRRQGSSLSLRSILQFLIIVIVVREKPLEYLFYSTAVREDLWIIFQKDPFFWNMLAVGWNQFPLFSWIYNTNTFSSLVRSKKKKENESSTFLISRLI